jgi:hypothetical protein
MKSLQTIRTVALALAAGAALAKEEKDEKVAFATLPEAVQKTILAQASEKSATVGDVDKEDEDSKVSYEAEIVQKDGKKLEVEVAADGSLIKVKADNDDHEEKGGKDDDDDDEKEEK